MNAKIERMNTFQERVNAFLERVHGSLSSNEDSADRVVQRAGAKIDYCPISATTASCKAWMLAVDDSTSG